MIYKWDLTKIEIIHCYSRMFWNMHPKSLLRPYLTTDVLSFWYEKKVIMHKINKQDFLQVFQGSRIGKMEDNLTSADPLSYTTNGSGVDLELRGKR